MFWFRDWNLAPYRDLLECLGHASEASATLVGPLLSVPHRIFGTEALVVQPTAFVRFGEAASDTPQDFN